MTDFDLSAYLARIGLQAAPRPDAGGLRALQAAQLRAVVFEDFDPFLGVTPDLAPAAVFEKIVHRGRGGYCFELNALFGAALAALGFSARRHMARVRRATPQGGPRSHLVLTVATEGGTFLADCGFGGPGALAPLRLGAGDEQQAPNGRYRLCPDRATGETVLERHGAAGWRALYGFDDAHVGDMDIAAANYLCANWSEMPFGNHLMLAGFDGDSRIGVFDREVTVETATTETRSRIDDIDGFVRLVTGRLGLPVDRQSLDRAWARLRDR